MISRLTLLNLLAEANELQSESRQLPYKSLVSAAYRAELVAYEEDDQKALLSDFANFAASSADRTKSQFILACLDLLPENHPATDSPLESRLAWVELDPAFSTKKGLVSSAVTSSGVENTHAWVRLKTLAKEGNIKEELLTTISALEIEAYNNG
jgi:hypothetical protein